MKKRNILIIMGRYLPGYKDGGPVRSIKNLVDYLGEEYNFFILTCDRDHGDTTSYSNIKVNDWNQVGKAKVYYVPPKGFRMKLIHNLSKKMDLIYVCGCFNDYAINTLILKRLNFIKTPVVVAAMGLFSPLSFKIKYIKKKSFIIIFNLLGMFRNVYWSASSKLEVNDIKKQIRVFNNIFIAEDLPRKIEKKRIVKEKDTGELKVVWISRIAYNKNLLGAIKILKSVKSNIEFTIYGPIHETEYWEECQKALKTLPSNIKWNYKGNLDAEVVVDVLQQFHVFLFPTFGENYGHVIHEALSAGCPVIISNHTPWNCVEKMGAGYVYRLEEKELYVEKIENLANMNSEEFQKKINDTLDFIIKDTEKKIQNNNGYIKIFQISNDI